MRRNLIMTGVIIALFLVGILFITITESFGEGWLIGLGLISLAAVITAVTLAVKARKK